MVDILHRIGAHGTSPEAAYRAVATRDGVAAWWIPGAGGEDQVGGTMTFGDLMKMRVVALEPTARVEWEVVGGPDDWMGTHITFEVKQEDDHAIVLFEHQGWAEANEHMHHCSTKWAVFLLSLKEYLETGQGRPGAEVLPTDNW